MPQHIKRTKATAEAEVENQPEQSTDTAVLEGDNIEDVLDYSHILKIQEDKLRITDRNGESAAGPRLRYNRKTKEYEEKPFPDWWYAWVINGKDGSRSQIGTRLMEKYQFVTPQSDPDLIVPALIDSVSGTNRYEINELTLMKLPMKYKEARDRFFKEQNDLRMGGIKRELDRDVDGNAYGEIEIRRGG